jgi:hypothetical protein
MLSDDELMRDLFACFALVGIVSRGETTDQYEMAIDAYKIADAMILQRAG